MYVVFFFLMVLLAIVINGLFLKFSSTLGNRELQRAGLERWSRTSKPSLGGISFYILFLLSVSVFQLIPDIQTTAIDKQLIGLIIGSTLGFFIGLADDAYNTNPFLKFLGQFLCANVFVATGTVIEISPFIYFNYVFTIFWVVGIMNSINMLDNMDGITASISITILIAALLFTYQGNIENAYFFIILGVIAALFGFLRHNWYPSKMYMGDTGSQFLGAFLSGLSIILFWKYRDPSGPWFQVKQMILPLTVFSIPAIDTLTVIIARAKRGQSPFVGGRDHTTHHLAYLGLRDDKVVILLSFISLVSVLIAYSFQYFYNSWNWIYTFIVSTYLLVLFVVIQFYYKRATLNK